MSDILSHVHIYVNNLRVQVYKFPGGDIQVKLNIDELKHGYAEDAVIAAYLDNSDSIMALHMVKSILDREKIFDHISLLVPKMPYMQQDRVMTPNECLSIKLFAEMYINPLKFHRVYTVGIHSEVTSAVINNIDTGGYDFMEKELSVLINETLPYNNTVLVSPDAGAEKRTFKLAQNLKLPYIVCRKIRNVNTGDIEKTTVDFNGAEDYINNDTHYLLVDDVCVGGRTFIEIVKSIKNTSDHQNNTFTLATYHAINPNNQGLLEHFDHVYAFPTFNPTYNNGDILPLDKLISIPMNQ